MMIIIKILRARMSHSCSDALAVGRGTPCSQSSINRNSHLSRSKPGQTRMDQSCDSQLTGVTRSVEDFTTSFHKNLAAKTAGNFVSSALSAHVVLSMTACGAEGNTALEFKQALKLPAPCQDSQLHLGFQYFIDALNSITGVVLKVANKIYVAKDIAIKDRFREITGTHFRSESETIDFSDSALAAKNINTWCSENTNDKIKKIIEPGDVNAATRLILLNAVYFKGNWKLKFDSRNTKDRPFHLSKTETKQVPTMYTERKLYYKYFDELDAECVALPYENENMYMLIVVPKNVDGLEKVEKNLEKILIDYEELKHACEKVELYLPKFKVETTIDLNLHLTELGMNEMFTNKANFRGISEEPLKVDKVVQKAFIEVNEEGSEAAAVTGVRLMKRSLPLPPIELQVDRPFLYRIILGDDHKVTLFSGRVNDPSSSSSSSSSTSSSSSSSSPSHEL